MTRLVGRLVHAATVEPLPGNGYSNASHGRVTLSYDDGRQTLVVKRTRVDVDWTALRSGDTRGREAVLLTERALAGVWDAFACPYLAFSIEPGEIGLLLDDLTQNLLPDVREPLTIEQETALLAALAGMHARFWESDALMQPWLVRPAEYCELLGPAVVGTAAQATFPEPLRGNVSRGWQLALARVPEAVRQHLARPGAEWQDTWRDLPITLLHGDVKVANFAMLGNGRVAAFDWALAGAGPCTIDVGWYLAVNASRLTASKDATLARYRDLLESTLGRRLLPECWRRLETVAVVTGARMLLWSKALALEAGRAGAADEWNWWIDRLRMA